MKKPEFILSDCAKCICFDSEKDCICQTSERFIRNYAAGHINEPLNKEQREYFIATADWCWEGAYTASELETMNDKELACNLLAAMHTYAQSQI